MRLARAAGASERSPVGFLVDAVGRTEVQAWDELQRKIAGSPGVLLLGTAREEDLFALRTLPACRLVHVALDEELAARIYRGLVRDEATKAPHWRAVYEKSAGLTLEFAHLLTRGRRLADVVGEQVRARRDEGRDLELDVLAIASVAHCWGASVPLAALRSRLGVSIGAMDRALQRLDEELLIDVRHGYVRGLHQIRSEAVVEAIHAHGSPSLAESACRVVELAEPEQLRPFVAGILNSLPELDAALTDALAKRIEREPEATLLAQSLQALRVVDFRRSASAWPAILERHGVAPADSLYTLQIALWHSTPMAGLRPEIRSALDEIGRCRVDTYPLRDRLLRRIGADSLAEILTGCTLVKSVERLLGALADAPAYLVERLASRFLSDTALIRALDIAPLADLAGVLSAARAASLCLADGVIEGLGGESAMLTRFRRQYPWAVELRISTEADEPTAVARLALLADEQSPDLDAQARELASLLLRCFPHCEDCDIETHLAYGVGLKLGDHPIGVSKLQRPYEHGPTQTAWNRQKLRLAASAVCAFDSAVWLHATKLLLDDLAQYLHELLRCWLRGNGQTALAARRTGLVQRTDFLAAPMEDDQVLAEDALKQGKALTHPFHDLARGLTDNLSRRLPEPAEWRTLVGYVGDVLPGSLAKLRTLDWHLIGLTEPPDALGEISETLRDLRDLLVALTMGALSFADLRVAARAVRRRDTLDRAAALSRTSINSERQRWTTEFALQLEVPGLHTEVHTAAACRSVPRLGARVRRRDPTRLPCRLATNSRGRRTSARSAPSSGTGSACADPPWLSRTDFRAALRWVADFCHRNV